MRKEIERFIEGKNNGLFLLDSPTGFGKTTAVVDYIEDFIKNNSNSKKRIFFFTNLKMNLPWKELKKRLGDELFYEKCIVLDSFGDQVINNWKYVKIDKPKVILNSDEYKILKKNMELYEETISELENINDDKTKKIRKQHLNNIKNAIIEKYEPEFREFIKKNYFYGKLPVEKHSFIKKYEWFSKLYPSSIMERYKVIFLSTAKFVNAIDSFYRMPYYFYEDDIINNTIVFIDEFDASKETLLNNIIEQDIKIQVDLVKLFLNIYYSINNIKLPKKILKVSEKLNDVINEGYDWKKPEEIIQLIIKTFNEKYKKYNFDLLVKSEGLEDQKAFLFDDGKSLAILKDNSKKNIYVDHKGVNDYIKLYADNSGSGSTKIQNLISDLHYCIDYFIRGTVFIAKNYLNLKNGSLQKNESDYTIEETIMTVISVFNISEEFVESLFKRAIEFNNGDDLNNKNYDEDNFMRKGFKFIEISDDRKHDLQSKFHSFSFHTTPEDIILKMARKANVVGISATASLPTVIGNYDISYFKKKLGDNYYNVSDEGKLRITKSFNDRLKIYDEQNININVVPIDEDINELSYRDKTEDIINKKLFLDEDMKDKHNKILEQLNETDTGNKNESKFYYAYIKYKLGLVYKYYGINNDIKSFLVFLNFSVTNEKNIKPAELKNLFKDIAKENSFDYVEPKFIASENFDENFTQTKDILKEGKRIFWISTYKTIGTGKNIQYDIPEVVIQNIVKDDDSRNDKDFDGIYLSTPTNLLQNLRFDSTNKYYDLSKYLFQQEYLHLKAEEDKLDYYKLKQNVKRGFKKIFYNLEDIYYKTNGDYLFGTAQIIIQAVGRICRCRNKNKNIHILTDLEIIKRMKKIKKTLDEGLYNKEFLALVNKEYKDEIIDLEKYSNQNKQTYSDIRKRAWRVRDNETNVKEWKDLRDYVLRNPTTNNIDEKYRKYYFEFNEEVKGYAYHKDCKYDFDYLNLHDNDCQEQVSEENCNLPTLLYQKNSEELFSKNGFAKNFDKGKFVMSESLYQQVYKGALGEVIGREILEKEGIELEEIKDPSMYELFDFKMKGKDIYFDFKNWCYYLTEHDKQCEKIRNKLKRVKGAKCFIVNLMSVNKNHMLQKIDDTIYLVPYLIDRESGEVSSKIIDFICESIN